MSSNDQGNIPDESVVTAIQNGREGPAPKHNDVADDDRINPIETSFTDESNGLDVSSDFDDMESLLPMEGALVQKNSTARAKPKILSLEIGEGDDNGGDALSNNKNKLDNIDKNSCRCIPIPSSKRIGNVRILFPDYFYSSGWGVVGPHIFGPVVVWIVLVTATHGVINGIKKHHLGFVSVVICYIFLGICTYRLTDIAYRDPGICLDREIPGHEPPERASQYRFCDRCKIWQPPDGVHCPECNVCVAGYDHHCVWMGTCIGKRNYREFVKFNMTWILYILYAFFWVLTIGPLAVKQY